MGAFVTLRLPIVVKGKLQLLQKLVFVYYNRLFYYPIAQHLPITPVYCSLLIKRIVLHMAALFSSTTPTATATHTLSSSSPFRNFSDALGHTLCYLVRGRERYDRSHLATYTAASRQLLNEYALSLNVLCDTDQGIIPP